MYFWSELVSRFKILKSLEVLLCNSKNLMNIYEEFVYKRYSHKILY